MMHKWDDGEFEIRYFYNDEFPGLTAHRYIFDDGFDFLEKYTNLLESLSKSKRLTVSKFEIVVNRTVVFIRFIKIRKVFRREKIIIAVSYSVGFCKEMKKSVKVKNQSRAELNDWINKALDEIESIN